MALTFEQFKALRDKGLSNEQIIKFEGGYVPPTTPTPEQPIKKTPFQKSVELGTSLAKGALKGAVSTTVGISSLAEKGLKALMPKSVEKVFGFSDTPVAQQLVPEQYRTPQGIAQKIGFGAEQVGELAIPIMPKGGGLIKNVVKGATEMGGKTALQTGGDADSVRNATIAGGGFPIAGKVLSPLAKIAQKIPETAWGSILKRTPMVAVKNPELEKQIAKEGLIGISKKAISKKAGKEIQNIELQIGQALEGKGGEVSTWNVIESLRKMHAAYKQIPGEEKSVEAIISIANGLLDKGVKISVKEANELKRNIYGLIQKSYGKGLLEVPAKTEAQKMLARGLKVEIEKAVPEVKNLNARQAIFIQTKNAIDKTIARETGKGIAGTGIGLYDIMIGGLGTGVGYAVHSPLVGVGAVIGKKTLESPLVLSSVANGTQKMLNYFDNLSPTQKVLFYNSLRGITTELTKKKD